LALIAGTRLGPYEVVGALGAGGMGEVYRARDEALGRDVALKVLPEAFATDPERLRRFKQEAQAAAALNHPNILAVYQIGQQDGVTYLEGETLRERLRGGALPQRKAVEIAAQIARGLAAAHGKGVVHRDLKPENVFVLRDGLVKILDFGLAKVAPADGGEGATLTRGSEPGTVLGSAGYMAPEQVRGETADRRSDLFALGAILYEMLAGRRAFQRDTSAETMTAILREDPPAPPESIAPGLVKVVAHCLEKRPEERFQAAPDLAFALEALSSGGSGSGIAASVAPVPRARGRSALVGAAALGLLLAGAWIGRLSLGAQSRTTGEAVPRKRLTFRRGNVLRARFTADAQNVVYAASWDGRPTEIYMTHVGSPETRPLGIEAASLLSISASGELAVLLKKQNLFGEGGNGVLARVPVGGGAPRAIAEGVRDADWIPGTDELAIVRDLGSAMSVELPLGKPVYTAAANISALRVSPDGSRVALVEEDGRGARVTIVDTTGTRKVLVPGFVNVAGLAWPPSGKEVWFNGVDRRPSYGIFAVTPAGALRTIATTTDFEELEDLSREGGVLVNRQIIVREILGATRGYRQERNLSWLEDSSVDDLSADGRTLLFDESSEGGGLNGAVYLRTMDGGPALRLGDGQAFSLSPDGKWALTIDRSIGRLRLLPTGPGEAKPVALTGIDVVWASHLPPEGKQLLIIGSEPGQGTRAYTMELPDGTPHMFAPELSYGGGVSPDGRRYAYLRNDRRAVICPFAGGEPSLIPGLDPGDVPIQWSPDGADLFVVHYGAAPLAVYRLHLGSGKKEVWKELMPQDRAGFVRIENVAMTRDGGAYAYSYKRVTASDLFLEKGWR